MLAELSELSPLDTSRPKTPLPPPSPRASDAGPPRGNQNLKSRAPARFHSRFRGFMTDLNSDLNSGAPEAEPTSERPASGRRADGTFAPGNSASLRHGLFSRQVRGALLPEQAEVLAALAEKRTEIERDLGGADAVGALSRDLVSRYLELSVIADYLGQQLVIEGPLTTKGNQRAALTAYLSVVDRVHRIAMTLGLERKTKPVNPLEAVRRAVEEANKK